MRQSRISAFRSFIGLSVSETNGLLCLMPLLGLVVFHEPLLERIFPPPEIPVHIVRYADSLLEVRPPVSMSGFDPNRVTADQLKALGMNPRLSERLIRYRSAGGRFRRPEDLLRLHGMDTPEYRRLAPWVRMAADPDEPGRKAPPIRQVPKGPRTFDLNAADTADFEAWPGIGPRTAVLIIRYRDALGGFLRRDQLYEVWAIDSLVVFSMQEFHVRAGFVPERINVNTATEEQLERHPYVSLMQARAILFYRFQHGPIKRMEELHRVRLLDSAVIRKLKPYLRLD